jgi:hypothetical protein
VLRLYDRNDEGRLHLLRPDEQHARLLLLLTEGRRSSANQWTGPSWFGPVGGFVGKSIARRSRPFGASGAGDVSPLEKAETAARWASKLPVLKGTQFVIDSKVRVISCWKVSRT